MKPLTVYDGHTMKRLAYLQNAYGITYTQNLNSLWTAEFSMPFSDGKNRYCESFNLIEIWDVDGGGKDRYVGLFRIMPRVEEALGIGANIRYSLEHVLGTLIDDTMLEWHEVGDTGVYTANVIAYILEHQSQKRWILDICDYDHQYLYGWQDENLLSALYSVVTPFSETDYYWDFDTKSFPWRLRLRKTSEIPVTDIRYKKNMMGMTKTINPTNLTTRLYCYGYGEGDNKLTIKNVNDGVPYLESPNVDKYGVITQVWTDERFTIEESLKATGMAMLEKLQEPTVTYEIDLQTISSAANLQIGDTVRVVEGLLDEYMVVRELTKDDLTRYPNSGSIVLGHDTIDLGESMANIVEKQRISEMYSQGTESIFMDSFYDNADNTNPSEVTFTIPDNAVHVNEIRFSAKLVGFRAYSRATHGGGAGAITSSDGGSNNLTSSNGGASVLSSSGGGESNQTSTDGGNSTITSSGGGGAEVTSQNGGGIEQSETYEHGTDKGNAVWSSSEWSRDGETSEMWGDSGSRTTTEVQSHTHRVEINHVHKMPTHQHPHNHAFSIPSHSHRISVPSHSHSVYLSSHRHNVYIPEHTHSVTIPTHTHSVYIPTHTHNITLPNHVHQIEYGIYKGPSARSMQVYLDDRLVGSYDSSIKDVNLIDYMNKNANGNILRGEHIIRIVPNSLTRIEANIQIRLFTNSHGGGQY